MLRIQDYKIIIGIDVSELKLDVWFMQFSKGIMQEHFIVNNNEKGVKEIIKIIKKQKLELANCLFCYENTGIYSMLLSCCLSKVKADHWVVNTLEMNDCK